VKYQKSEMPVHSAVVGAPARVSHEPQPDAWLQEHGPVFALALLATWIWIIALTIWRHRPRRQKLLPRKIKRGPMPFGGYDADPGSRHHWNN
jgi:hypothetical protein